MKGFFSAKEVTSNINIRNPQSCVSCGLYQNCTSPKMKPYGKGEKGVMFIGRFPEQIDDKRGKPFQGRLGRSLQKVLKELNFDLFRDAVCLNACNCLPPEREKPSDNQIYCCRASVLKSIKQHNPKVIILLGNTPLQSIIGNVWKKALGGIEKWRGFQIPDQTLKTFLCPVYDPSFVSRNEDRDGKNLAYLIWKRDLGNAIHCVNKSFPIIDNLDDRITYIESNAQLKEIIPKLINADLLSFDYEATGLKPHADTQKLISVSAAISDTEVYTWINDKTKAKLFKKVLQSKVPKAAHNLQMEEEWSYWHMGTTVNNWDICTMNMAHCLDNRSGITSLKFQTYVNFGVPDYDSHIHPYLVSDGELGANSINKIEQFIKEYGEKELLKYNALDSLFGWMLAIKQKGIINENINSL